MVDEREGARLTTVGEGDVESFGMTERCSGRRRRRAGETPRLRAGDSDSTASTDMDRVVRRDNGDIMEDDSEDWEKGRIVARAIIRFDVSGIEVSNLLHAAAAE